MDRQGSNYVILNFLNHNLAPGAFPDKYKVVNIPIKVDPEAEDIDIKTAKLILKVLEENNLGELKFKVILVLPAYEPMKLLIFMVITELFGNYPIVAKALVRNQFRPEVPIYQFPMLVKRVSKLRRTSDNPEAYNIE
jgi:hypothetical protein